MYQIILKITLESKSKSLINCPMFVGNLHIKLVVGEVENIAPNYISFGEAASFYALAEARGWP